MAATFWLAGAGIVILILLVWAGFELKHVVADYWLQTDWMVRDKADLTGPGGYAHAGMHVAWSLPILYLAQTPPTLLAGLLLAEFAVHYTLDFTKAALAGDVDPVAQPRAFWALHGLDQTFHRLTYVGMTAILVTAA